MLKDLSIKFYKKLILNISFSYLKQHKNQLQFLLYGKSTFSWLFVPNFVVLISSKKNYAHVQFVQWLGRITRRSSLHRFGQMCA